MSDKHAKKASSLRSHGQEHGNAKQAKSKTLATLEPVVAEEAIAVKAPVSNGHKQSNDRGNKKGR